MRPFRSSLSVVFITASFLIGGGCTPSPDSSPIAPAKTEGTGATQPAKSEGSGTTQPAKADDSGTAPAAKAVEGQ